MSYQPNQSKRNARRWARVVLFGSVMGSSLAGSWTSTPLWGQTPSTRPSGALTLPPLPSYSQNAVTSPTQPSASDARLQVYDVPSQFVGTVGAHLQVHFHGNPAVRVTTDPKTGKLMIMAPEAVHREISAQIDNFLKQNQIPAGDRGMSLASYQQQSYSLKNLSWRELEDAIQQLSGSRLSMTTERNGEIANLQITNSHGKQDVMQVDRRQNKVTLLGTSESSVGWSQVIYSLDQGQADATKLTQIVPLAPAEPRRVRRAIQLINTTIQDQAGGQTQAQVELGDEAATAMGSLDTLGSDSGLFGDVQIEFIEEIDLVIIRGSKRDVQRTLEVIEKIKEQAKETQPEVEVLPLQYANNEAVATLVTELYDSIYAPRQGTVSITPLVQPNALLLIGRKEVVQSVKALVSKIDQPLDPLNQLKVIPLQFASSADVESRIREFFVVKPGGDDADRAGLGTRVKVLSDYRTNSLIIQAAPREMQEVESLIASLDVESAKAENEVRVFRLSNTLSDELQTVIQEVITGQTTGTGGGGAGTAQATPPSGKITIVGKQGAVESGLLAGVVVTSDPTANALVVRAPSASMELIAALIRELDQLPSAEAKIKVYPIENGDATQLAATLQQLYGLQVTAGQSTTGGLFGLGNLNQASLTAGGDSSLVQLNITQDVRTNSIIVSGSTADLEVIEALIYRLDIEGVETRRTEVVWLRNATAEFVATALTSYLQQQQQVNQQLLLTNQAISFLDQADREVFVVAESETNSLILSATPRYFETIMSVIERLDRRPPVVSIQVLIAEVSLDDSFELGAEFGLQDGLLFDRQSATGGTLGSPVFNLGNALTGPSGGVGQTQNVAAQGLSSFAVGRASSSTPGVGGLVLSASSEAVGILVRALQTSGRLQVLSRPQITTMDARPASTLVGQLVPRVTGVTQAQFGQTINAVDSEVGLGLAVLPRVNQDGLIVMQVEIQNSSVGDVNSGIPVGFGPTGEVIRSPIINTTQATTTVSAYSGQTVVFAGLIQKTRASSRSQVPILGSLPLIGAAFRFDTETEQRRELLVVLTPRIIQNDEDYEVLKNVESSRMSWCLADVLNIHGDTGLSGGNGLWGPAKSPVIYPDLQPTVIQDRAMPPANRMLAPEIIEGVPLGQGGNSIIENTEAPILDSSAQRSTGNSVFRQASFAQPVNSTSAAPAATSVPGYGPVQRGAY